MVNSGDYSGLPSEEGKRKIISYIERKKEIGKGAITYRLRDWLISRQRYWGAPIPILYCNRCGEVPVSEKTFLCFFLKMLTSNRVDLHH